MSIIQVKEKEMTFEELKQRVSEWCAEEGQTYEVEHQKGQHYPFSIVGYKKIKVFSTQKRENFHIQESKQLLGKVKYPIDYLRLRNVDKLINPDKLMFEREQFRLKVEELLSGDAFYVNEEMEIPDAKGQELSFKFMLGSFVTRLKVGRKEFTTEIKGVGSFFQLKRLNSLIMENLVDLYMPLELGEGINWTANMESGRSLTLSITRNSLSSNNFPWDEHWRNLKVLVKLISTLSAPNSADGSTSELPTKKENNSDPIEPSPSVMKRLFAEAQEEDGDFDKLLFDKIQVYIAEEELLRQEKIWAKANEIPNYDVDTWRWDINGQVIKRTEYRNYASRYGWEIQKGKAVKIK